MAEQIHLSFNLHHLKQAYVYEILRTTGWQDIVDYQMNVVSASQYNEYVTFPLVFSKISDENSKMKYILNTPTPIVDNKKYFTTRLMITAFDVEYQHVITDTMGTTLTRFEMEYPKRNSIYVSVPYKSWFMNEMNSVTHSDEAQNTQDYTLDRAQNDEVQVNNNDDDCSDMDISSESECSGTPTCSENDNISDEYRSDDDSEYDPEDEYFEKNEFSDRIKKDVYLAPLADFNFKKNPATLNSYILYRARGPSYNDKSPWELFPNYRPLYYSKKYGGYIVGLDMLGHLYGYGATEDKSPLSKLDYNEMEEVD